MIILYIYVHIVIVIQSSSLSLTPWSSSSTSTSTRTHYIPSPVGVWFVSWPRLLRLLLRGHDSMCVTVRGRDSCDQGINYHKLLAVPAHDQRFPVLYLFLTMKDFLLKLIILHSRQNPALNASVLHRISWELLGTVDTSHFDQWPNLTKPKIFTIPFSQKFTILGLHSSSQKSPWKMLGSCCFFPMQDDISRKKVELAAQRGYPWIRLDVPGLCQFCWG